MKIVSIVSSCRRNGNTGRIAGLIEKRLLSAADRANLPLEIERIALGHLDIGICQGCRVCFDKGEERCPLKDDLLSVREKIRQADGILAASPVYVEDVNGAMKNWIDRMAFICHRPEFAGKVAYIVTTSGAGSSKHAVNTMKTAFNTWGIKISGQSRFRTGDLMTVEEMEAKHGRAISKAADDLFKAIRDSSPFKPSFYSLVAYRVQKRYWKRTQKYRNTVDYQYWKDKGWLEDASNYYIPHGAGLPKVKLAQWISRIVMIFLR